MDIVEIRTKLAKCWNDLEAEKITVQQAKAQANIAHGIINTYKIELVRAQMLANGSRDLPKLALVA